MTKTEYASIPLFSFRKLRQGIISWIQDKTLLFQCIGLSLVFHILLLPILWCIGLILPWPQSPVVTTVIELDLNDWPKSAKTKKVFDYRDPALNSRQ